MVQTGPCHLGRLGTVALLAAVVGWVADSAAQLLALVIVAVCCVGMSGTCVETRLPMAMLSMQ